MLNEKIVILKLRKFDVFSNVKKKKKVFSAPGGSNTITPDIINMLEIKGKINHAIQQTSTGNLFVLLIQVHNLSIYNWLHKIFFFKLCLNIIFFRTYWISELEYLQSVSVDLLQKWKSFSI